MSFANGTFAEANSGDQLSISEHLLQQPQQTISHKDSNGTVTATNGKNTLETLSTINEMLLITQKLLLSQGQASSSTSS